MADDRKDSAGRERRPTLATEAHPILRDAVHPDAAQPPGNDSALPEHIGPFRVLGLLGRGGMGTVFLAEQRAPLPRRVALKLIRKASHDSATVRRFQAEAQALARMTHPVIAHVYEAGTIDGGEPYIAMEHVDGPAITVYAERNRLSIEERLDLFARVCDGIAHAHEKAILHRDIKPTNVLVGEVDGVAAPKIIDFGIAKFLDEPGNAPRTTRWIGTPAYLSPEALGAEQVAPDVDTRSDVYSLGVLLFALLAGDHPFGEGSSLPVLRRIADDERIAPSAWLRDLDPTLRAAVARRRGLEPRAHERALAGELDWIVAKAMARDRGQRYPSAAALAADVRNHLAGRPLLAGPPGRWYPLQKLVRRNFATVVASALVSLALVGGCTARALEARRANREADRANQEAVAAQQVSAFLIDLFAVADPGSTTADDITARALLDRGAERIGVELADQPLVRVRLLDAISGAYFELGAYPRAESLLRDALSTLEARETPPRSLLGSVLVGLANALQRQGRIDDADPFVRRAIAIEAADEDRAAQIVRSRALVVAASIAVSRGQNAEAEPLLQEAIAVTERAQGSEHPRLAAVLNNLANLHFDERRFAEAEAMHIRAIEIKEKRLGPDHFHLGQSLNNLANVYLEQGDYDRAEPLHRRALDIKRKALPSDHVEIGVSLHNLGNIAAERGRFEEALRLHRESEAIFAAKLSRDHPFFGYVGIATGNTLVALGRLDEAEAPLRRALEIRSALDPESIYLREVVDALATLLRKTGRDEEASALEAQFPRPSQAPPDEASS